MTASQERTGPRLPGNGLRMNRNFTRGAAWLALGAVLLSAGGAGAQASRGGPFGTGNSPIDIAADELEVLDAENRAVWRGNVEAVQGQNRMRAPSLTIFYASRGGGGQAVPGAGGGEIQRMEATGPVYYVTPTQNARGDAAVYEAASNTITMTGNVVLVQDKNVVQGDRLVIDTRTNHATLVSNNRGRGSQRVRGVFYPSNQAQAGGQTQQRPAAGATARP